jgi:ElaA protein
MGEGSGGGDWDAMQLEWREFNDFSAIALYELLRFRQAIFVVEQSSPFPDLDDLDRRGHHLLLRIDGALAGYARVIPYDSDRVAIGRVAVAAAWRRRGFGRLIMQEALARCRHDYPGRAIMLSAQTYLAPFYGSLGFHAVSGAAVDYGIEHIEMEWRP